jgi:hypothetical protein
MVLLWSLAYPLTNLVRKTSAREGFGHIWSVNVLVILRADSHYGHPSREAVELSGQTLLRVQRNGLKINSQQNIVSGAFGRV